MLEFELFAIYTAGTMVSKIGKKGLSTLVHWKIEKLKLACLDLHHCMPLKVKLTATVDPDLPTPWNRILLTVSGIDKRLAMVPNTNGSHLKGRNPKSLQLQTQLPKKAVNIISTIMVIWASVTSKLPNLIWPKIRKTFKNHDRLGLGNCTHKGNFSVFLSFRFYVKPILENVGFLKMTFLLF